MKGSNGLFSEHAQVREEFPGKNTLSCLGMPSECIPACSCGYSQYALTQPHLFSIYYFQILFQDNYGRKIMKLECIHIVSVVKVWWVPVSSVGLAMVSASLDRAQDWATSSRGSLLSLQTQMLLWSILYLQLLLSCQFPSETCSSCLQEDNLLTSQLPAIPQGLSSH